MAETENGLEAGVRNVGRFFLAAIALVLAVSASAWLAFAMGARDAMEQIAQEERAAIVVGAGEPLTLPVKIDIQNLSCVVVTRADLKGTALRLYARNDCNRRLSYVKWGWEAVSPNRTVLHSNWTNQCPVPALTGDSAECVLEGSDEVPIDERIETLRVWATDRP